jgi:hypothetical protein
MVRRQVLDSIAKDLGEFLIGISVMFIELVYGATRANTPERRSNRQKFIEEL